MSEQRGDDERLEERQPRWGFASLCPNTEGELETHVAMIVNVSPNGLRVETQTQLEVGQQVIAHIRGETGARDLLAEVRWAERADNGVWELGLQIDHLPGIVAEELQRTGVCMLTERPRDLPGAEERSPRPAAGR